MLSVVLPRKSNSLPDLAQIFLGTSYDYCLRPQLCGYALARCKLNQMMISNAATTRLTENKHYFRVEQIFFFISGAANAAVSQIAPLCHISSSLYPSCNLG
jgi:hypothetical protein